MKKLDPILAVATWLNFAAVLVVAVLIMGIGEHWWFSTALCYLPRFPWMIPSLILIPLLLWRRWKWTPLAILPAIIVIVPLMGLSMPVAKAEQGPHAIRIASCNIQDGKPRIISVAREFKRFDPDIIVLQECNVPQQRLLEDWPDYHHINVNHLDILSRWPIELVDTIASLGAARDSAAHVRVDHPERPFHLVDVHLSTARHGLVELRNTAALGDAIGSVTDWQAMRHTETLELATSIREFCDEPVVLAGDFNQPWSSQFIQESFSGWTNAFDVAGTGYGYTTPTDTRGRWPHNTPWIRVDHIVVNQNFGVTNAEVGRSAGSDHRMIIADLTW